MTPFKAALQLYRAWAAAKASEDIFPIDCKAIAEGLSIRVEGGDLDGEFEGGLFIEEGLTAIIYNENIEEDGRKNFTIAHELGHFSLHKNRRELRCTFDDLNNFGGKTHPHGIEQEANSFAANLLMPADDFRPKIRSCNLSLAVIGQLAYERYATTLTAAALRAQDLAGKPCAVIMLRDDKVKWWRRNDSMSDTGLWLHMGQHVKGVGNVGREGAVVDSRIWLPEHKCPGWEITQSDVAMKRYEQTLVFLTARSKEGEKDWLDEVKDSVDLLPKW